MNRRIKAAVAHGLIALTTLALCPAAHAGVIKFDEYPAQNANGVIAPATYINWGATFLGTDDGSTWDGTSKGDPGGWGVEGTAGSTFSGFNGASYANRLVFNRTVRSFAIDVARTAGSSAGDSLTLEGWKGGVMVESRTLNLDAINTWRTAILFEAVDEVRWSGSGSGFHPFAIDNVRWTNTRTSRILFDEYSAQNSNGALTATYVPLGVSFSGSDDGSTWDGTSRGDPGGWGVNGTQGSVFAGFNGASYGGSFQFDSAVKHVALDVSRTAGSQAGDSVTLEGWKNGVLVEAKTVTLGGVNTWTTVTLLNTVDEVRVAGAGAGFHPFSIDNLRWTSPDAGLILFDEFAADNANGPLAAARYQEWGVTFAGVDDGSTWSGISQGDPGGWGVEGTNGSLFAGFNGGSYSLAMLFDGIIEDFMLDVSRTSGSGAGDLFTLEGYFEGLLVDSITAQLSAINTWMPFALSGQIDEVRLFGTGSGFHPFAIDNLNWLWIQRNDGGGNNTTPEPGTLALLGLGLAGLAATRRRKQ